MWNTLLYNPIYNALIFIIDHITFGDVGFAIIIVTILVKLVISPLTAKSIRGQVLMKKMEPEIKQIKKDFPNKEEQAKKTFELYKKYKTNPFSGCLIILIQLPIILALYKVFYSGIIINESILYSFVQIPASMNTNFIGFFEMGSKSIILGVITGVTQFIQGYLASPAKPKNIEIVKEEDIDNKPKDFQEHLTDSMQMNVRYVLPVFIGVFAWQISAAVALYWIVSNIFTIVQEWYIRRIITRSII